MTSYPVPRLSSSNLPHLVSYFPFVIIMGFVFITTTTFLYFPQSLCLRREVEKIKIKKKPQIISRRTKRNRI
ncbi:hypothetical protein K445DRAFT_314284, partial [Daldinia sp. EC12]